MFDENDDQGEYYENNLNEDLERFEAFLGGEAMGFLDSDRWEALVDHFLISGQYQKASLCSQEALHQFSYNTLFKLRLAQSYSATGRLKDALNLLSELERSGVSSMELMLTKASVFSQLKDTKNAIKYFKAALNSASMEDRGEIFLDLAMEYINKGDLRLAVNVLREAIKENPSNEGAIYELAFCYDQLGEYEKSIECYSNFIDDNPYSFTAWYNLGNAFTKTENYEKALWAYDYCVLINDEFGPVHFNLGHAYLSLNKFRKALECFDRSMELDGDDPLALCYMGECHEQLNELELAKQFYKRSLELAPMLHDAWLGLGIVEDLNGRTKEAIVLIHKAAELDPENASIYHVLAGAYEKIEEREKACEYYYLSLAIDPTDEECLINYYQYMAEESEQSALDYLKALEETASENPMLNVLRVRGLYKVGRTEDALDLFKECLLNDKDKAKEVFEICPALKNVSEFVLLADQ